MRRGVEIPGHLHRNPRARLQLAGPPHQELGVFGHPLQGGIAHHHIGVRLRVPGPHIADVSVHTAFSRGVDHLR
jgi:hypothetical protein